MSIEDVNRADVTQLNAIVGAGLLLEYKDVKYAICDECADRCSVEVQRIFDADGRLTQAYCRCEERDDIIGRIPIPMERLMEWRTSGANLAIFLSRQLGATKPPIQIAAERIWNLGPLRYAGQRADVFMAIAVTAQDFSAIWSSVASSIDQCSTPVLLVPGDIPIDQSIGAKLRTLSLTRVLGFIDDRLALDVEEILRCAGIGAPPSDDRDFIHNDDYTSVRLNDQPYCLTINQSLVIKTLHQAYEHKTYWVGKAYLLEEVLETNPDRLKDTLRSNTDAWKNLIVFDRRGKYRLNLPIT